MRVSIMGSENDDKNGQTLIDHLSQTDCEQLNSCATNTPYIPIEIGDNVIEGARQVLEVIRPTWSSDSIKFKVRIKNYLTQFWRWRLMFKIRVLNSVVRFLSRHFIKQTLLFLRLSWYIYIH